MRAMSCVASSPSFLNGVAYPRSESAPPCWQPFVTGRLQAGELLMNRKGIITHGRHWLRGRSRNTSRGMSDQLFLDSRDDLVAYAAKDLQHFFPRTNRAAAGSAKLQCRNLQVRGKTGLSSPAQAIRYYKLLPGNCSFCWIPAIFRIRRGCWFPTQAHSMTGRSTICRPIRKLQDCSARSDTQVSDRNRAPTCAAGNQKKELDMCYGVIVDYNSFSRSGSWELTIAAKSGLKQALQGG